MEASGKIGTNGVYVSDNVGKRFETDIYIHTYIKRHGTLPTTRLFYG
jgi:hypothetical protein